jgi:DNA-binding NarL/FixJ family response regulator
MVSSEPQNRESPVRVLVVDDQRLMRDGIASLLSIQEGIEIVGTAGNGQEAIEQAITLQPDVVLMDVRMPVMDGVAATAELHRQLPSCRVLMLTTFDDEEYIVDALRAGASGYLLKDVPAPDLAKAVISVHFGIYQFDAAVAGKMVSRLAGPGSKSTIPPPAPTLHPLSSITQTDLSEREIEVLRLIAKGATNREIAEQLVITEGTVKNHISSILGRLGLRDRTQAALYAREHDLL